MGFDFAHSETVKILEVLDEWIRIEYTRTKENHLLKKEIVVKLIDINAVNGFEIMDVYDRYFIDYDEEWVMLEVETKKKKTTKMFRIENVGSIKEIIH